MEFDCVQGLPDIFSQKSAGSEKRVATYELGWPTPTLRMVERILSRRFSNRELKL